MDKVGMIGIDLVKNSFQLHGARADGSVAFRKKLSRGKVLEFMASQPRCAVAMEACAGAHYWGREIGDLGHSVRLIPPQYVKPYVKRQKNDAADAEAICEASSRPTMNFVAIETADVCGGDKLDHGSGGFSYRGRSKTLPPVAFDPFGDGRWEDVHRGCLFAGTACLSC